MFIRGRWSLCVHYSSILIFFACNQGTYRCTRRVRFRSVCNFYYILTLWALQDRPDPVRAYRRSGGQIGGLRQCCMYSTCTCYEHNNCPNARYTQKLDGYILYTCTKPFNIFGELGVGGGGEEGSRAREGGWCYSYMPISYDYTPTFFTISVLFDYTGCT